MLYVFNCPGPNENLDVMLAMATEKAVPTTNEFVQTGLTASNPVQIAPFAAIISSGP